jgi:hypothetical protein
MARGPPFTFDDSRASSERYAGWRVSGALRIPVGSEIDRVMRALDDTAAPRVVDADADPNQPDRADGFGGMLTEVTAFDSRR